MIIRDKSIPKFFNPMNYTQIPNEFFEVWLKKLNFSETKVLLIILYNYFSLSESKKMSKRELKKYTGLSNSTIKKSTKILKNHQLIKSELIGKRGFQETYYELIIQG